MRLEAHGATAREREVATLIARGLTNPEIADALSLARVFLDEYLPEVIRQTPLTSHGRFEVG